ncbi:hypothetical protein [Corynebacterium sp. CNJ-954]|uniref:hypothetical protein n=1 Tax=Corynebacterium sp. CNJ-954 TaxID=1904962 RepID=UPI0011151793|nr:hypothetical protein [Corynebacterium sp. CNJ-954]
MRGTRGVRGVSGRYTGVSRRRREKASPVLLMLDDPGLVDEVAMIITVTGRQIVREGEVADLPGLVVVTDSPDPEVPETVGGRSSVRVIRVSGVPGDGSGALQIPEAANELAAVIGCHDPRDIAVAGVVGGAGTSIFAAALAGAVADPGPDGTDGPGQALLVDDDPLSRSGQFRLLLGAERDGEGDPADREVTWVQDVGVVEPRSSSVAVCTALPSRPVVRDCGRRDLSALPETVTARILVVPQTVPAVLAARHVVDTCSRIHVVLRELPRSGLTWNQTLSLLGRAPTVTWEDDPFLTVDVDRGDFRPTGSAAGTAGTAALRLLEELR